MPTTTPNRNYPYPLGADPINVALDIERLAKAVDLDVNTLLVNRFANKAALDAWTTAPAGTLATTTALPMTTWIKTATIWLPHSGALPAIYMQKADGAGIASGQWVTLGWTGPLQRRLITWPTATEIRADYPGIYDVFLTVRFSSNGAGQRLSVIGNPGGYNYYEGTHPGTGPHATNFTIGGPVTLNAGDVVQAKVYQDSGAGLTLGGATATGLNTTLSVEWRGPKDS